MVDVAHYPLVIIGAGPAGIAAAIEWIEMGGSPDEVLILEKGEVPIEAIRRFYPDKKMTIANYKNLPTETLGHIPKFADLTKAETLTYFDNLISKYKLNVKFNAEVFKIIREESKGTFELHFGREKVTSQFVLIGIGILGRPKKPEYKVPNTLRNEILYDLTTQAVKSSKVLIVGGGDSSAEYCPILFNEGCEVTLAIRGPEIKRMMDQNLALVTALVADRKLRLHLSCEIEEVQDSDGKPLVIYKSSTSYQQEKFDKVIYAIGGTTPINFLKTSGVECDAVSPKYGSAGETNVNGLFLIGDLVCGRTGGSIITAYNSAFRTIGMIRKQPGGV